MGITETRDNPYLEGLYAPIDHEVVLDDLKVEGEIPKDLNGVFVRNGPNPRYTPPGRHHWFDGDAMLHSMSFCQGQVAYRNRWIRAPHFEMEAEAGKPLWGGLMEPFAANPKVALFKDTANTDVLAHNGELKAMWYLSGDLVTVDPVTLETQGVDTLGGDLMGKVSAHAKVDPRSGELLFFGFGMKPPFMFYGEADATGKLQYQVPVPLPGPRLPHDMAFTDNYAILMDLPVFYNMEALKKGRWKSEFHRDMPSRFALVPRKGRPGEIRWFESTPCYIYHAINAWEEGNEVVMVGCKVDEPINAPRDEDGMYAQMMANLRVRARLQRWRFNLDTGKVTEEPMDDRNTEFPSVNLGSLGRPSKYTYNMMLADAPTLLFEGITKFNIETAASSSYAFGDGWYGSEAPFAPRDNAKAEDEGYLVSFMRGGPDDKSELHVFDAQSVEKGPLARITIPMDVPLGFHATWVPANDCRKV